MNVVEANDVVGKWIPPIDNKTDSLFGGGILGGLGIAPYVGDVNGVKSNVPKTYTTIEFPQNPSTDGYGGMLVIGAIAIGVIAVFRIIFD